MIRFTRLQSKKPIKSKNLLQLNNTRLIITSTKIQFLYIKKKSQTSCLENLSDLIETEEGELESKSKES